MGYVALARLAGEQTPRAIELRSVARNGNADVAALGALRDAGRYLVTLRGDEYRLVFEVPEDKSATILVEHPAAENLRPFARFPQGPPEGVDLLELPKPQNGEKK